MKRRNALLLLALALVALPASDCDGNIGDVSTGPTSFRISAAANFTPADGPSTRPTTNADGTLVAFETRALNLARVEPSFKEILLRDRTTMTTTSVSRLAFEPNKEGLADCEGPSMSADGEYVAFNSRRDLRRDDPATTGPETFHHIWVYSRFDNRVDTVVPTLPAPVPPDDYITPVNGDCGQASLSGNGQVIAFTSRATNLATAAPYTMNPSGDPQVFVYDQAANEVRLLSYAAGSPNTACNGPAFRPVVSRDGQWIVFQSIATNLVSPNPSLRYRRIYRASLDGSVVELVSRMDGVAGAPADDHCGSHSVNADGSLIGFTFQGGNLDPAPNFGDLRFPLIVRDFNAPGGPTNRVVAQDCFMFGIFPGVNSPFLDDVSVMSADGRSIAYTAASVDIQDLEIRVADTAGGGSRLISKGIVQQDISQLAELFPLPTLSGDGRWIFWRSDYEQEVIGDSNALGDIFGYGPLR